MDPQIRTRLLAMAAEYRSYTDSNISYLAGIGQFRMAAETQKNILTAQLAQSWAETRLNEQVRNAQLAQVLLADRKYQETLTRIQEVDERVKENNLLLECLRFERDIVTCIANNDDALRLRVRERPGFAAPPEEEVE